MKFWCWMKSYFSIALSLFLEFCWISFLALLFLPGYVRRRVLCEVWSLRIYWDRWGLVSCWPVSYWSNWRQGRVYSPGVLDIFVCRRVVGYSRSGCFVDPFSVGRGSYRVRIANRAGIRIMILFLTARLSAAFSFFLARLF